MNSKERLTNLCQEALHNKQLNGPYQKRLKDELHEIEVQEEFDYFLNFYDHQNKFDSNENNLLVPFLLGIVNEFDINKDPNYIYGEYPDVDIDYIPEVREYLKDEYSIKKYGGDRVCNIATYATFGLRSSLLDMARVLNINRNDVLKLTKVLAVKDDEGEVLTWDKALEIYDDLRVFLEQYPELADAAKKLLHRTRSLGQHASGVVVSGSPIKDFVPLVVPKGSAVPATSWIEGQQATDLSTVGLVKFDFLSLDGNNKVAHCCKLVKEKYGCKIAAREGQGDWTNEDYLEDEKALTMANEGDLRTIFQFDGSPGIRRLAKEGGVTAFDDLVAYTALYRPGPLAEIKSKDSEGEDIVIPSMAKTFVNRKRGKEQYERHPILDPILNRTYGVLCIHEDTLVSLGDGREIPIRNIKKGDLVHSVCEKIKKVEIKECHGCGPTRITDGLCLTLKNGLSVTLTKDHKVLTYYGMKEAQELNKNDLIACPLILPQKRKKNPIAPWLGSDKDVAYFLGLITGDAQITSSIDLCTGLKSHHDKICNWITSHLPKLKIHSYFHTRAWHAIISCPELIDDPNYNGKRRKKLSKLMDDLNLRKTCYNKEIPDLIFSANSKIRYAYLAGLFDSNGCITTGNRGIQIAFVTSVSKNILNGIRKLCQLSGISFQQTLNRIYLWDTKKTKKLLSPYLSIKSFEGKCTRGRSNSHIPKDELLGIAKIYKSIRDFCKKTKIARSVFRKKNRLIKTNTAIKSGIFLGDIRYYKIESITEVQNQQFYGMSVSDNHNLIGNGIVIKNCYQEQVLKILNAVGRIPLKDCETVRKAISKKKIDKFKNYKEMFIKNGQDTLSWSKEHVENLWKQIEAFAGYGFNQAHATAYTYISSRMLYLKAHYPIEFYASVLTHTKAAGPKDYKKLKDYKREIEKHGIQTEKLDINKSGTDFRIIDNKIYYAFSKIRGIGDATAQRLVSLQPYKDFSDFLLRFGTDAKVCHAIIALRLFENEDPIRLYKFYEEIKAYDKKQSERKGRYEKAIEKLELEMNNLPQGEEFNKIQEKIRLKGISYTNKCAKDIRPNIENFNEENVIVDEKMESLLTVSDEAEMEFYGFAWKHPVERCANYNHDNVVEKFNRGDVGGLDVYIKKVEEKKGKKVTFYSVLVEDAAGEEARITVWKDAYERFSSLLKEKSLVRIRVNAPMPPFPNFTIAGQMKPDIRVLPLT